MTIFEALTRAAAELKSDSPRVNAKLDAQVLLSAVLHKPSSYLFAHGDEVLEQSVVDTYFTLVARRKTHEPIAYILGEKEFYKRPFTVTPATLIPRPDTEVLVEQALKAAKPETVFLDVGTGSGALAVTLAAESSSGVFATDISQDALSVAKENAERNGVQDRVVFLAGNLLDPFLEKLRSWKGKAEIPSLIITANLPYISRRQYEGLDPDVKNFEPKSALLAGIDGLDLYDELFESMYENRGLLPADLMVIMEIDPSQVFSATRLIKHYFPDAKPETGFDLSRKPRIISAMIPTRHSD